MGIKLKPGPKLPTQVGGLHRYCYTHLLPERFRTTHILYAQHSVAFSVAYVRFIDRKDGDRLGHIDAGINRKALDISDTFLDPRFRGQKIGLAMYEALVTHGLEFLGVKRLMGGDHSSMAARCHRALIKKHGLEGLGYRPAKQDKEKGDYDGAYGPYTYSLVA